MTKTAENGKVCVAMITTAHGVRGLVKVKSYTKQARDFASYGALSDESDKRSFKAEIVGQTGDVFLVRLDGISDRTAAEALRGVKLFVDRKALPETSDNEFYYADLIGMTAKTADGGVHVKLKDDSKIDEDALRQAGITLMYHLENGVVYITPFIP